MVQKGKVHPYTIYNMNITFEGYSSQGRNCLKTHSSVVNNLFKKKIVVNYSLIFSTIVNYHWTLFKVV